MRNALGLMLASVVTAVLITAVWFWTSSPRADAAPPQTVAARKAEPLPAPAAKLAPKDDVEITASLSKPAPAPAPVPAAQPARSACANPDALGVSRTVVIDTTGGPGFGFLQYKQFDFLTDKEVVLTFDDGPWPTTPAVLKALADECTKAAVLPGRQAHHLSSGNPQAGRRRRPHRRLAHLVARASRQQEDDGAAGQGRDREGLQRREDGDRHRARAVLPLPRLGHTQAALGYLASRNISMFSVDVDSNDFKSSGPDQVIKNVMTKLDKQGKGIILMHDLQKHTAIALPTLLRRLKAGGYKVVQMKAKEQLETLPEYDAMLVKDQKVPAVASRPISSVVQTVSQ